MTEEKKVTSVLGYREKLSMPKTITVPSGAVFKVKRLTPVDYIKEGLEDIPNEFFKFIGDLKNGNVESTLGEEKEEASENIKFFERFLTITVEKGILDPPTVLKYDKDKLDTHLIYAELTVEDQKMLVDVITGKLSF